MHRDVVSSALVCARVFVCACVCVCVLCFCVLKSSEGKKILRSLGVPTDEQDGGQGGGDMHAAGCAEAGTHTHTA